ncbi:MAG: hypothetical protein HUN04_25125 [Desulfobacter sp.]|nr:MAG: hypothetical protein HUN04_25125 [Desulfobacter sp.]
MVDGRPSTDFGLKGYFYRCQEVFKFVNICIAQGQVAEFALKTGYIFVFAGKKELGFGAGKVFLGGYGVGLIGLVEDIGDGG